MQIIFKKGRDKPGTITCIRTDGSRTWAQLFPNFEIHDLAHYAVETQLELTDSFFGLIDQGYKMSDFSLPKAERPEALQSMNLPPQALVTEHIVNLLTVLDSDTDFLVELRKVLTPHGLSFPLQLTDPKLMQIRHSLDHLLHQWRALKEGESFTLHF